MRSGAGRTGCSDAMSAPFEYPCVEKGGENRINASVSAAPIRSVSGDMGKGERGENTHDKHHLTHVVESLDSTFHKFP